jgi:hypothetical protein
VIKWRRKSWTGHVAHTRMIKAYKLLLGKSQETRPHDLNVYGEITLKWILKKQDEEVWTDSFGSK